MINLAIVGAKNSGKTAVMEGLVSHLTGKGYRVATIKHTSHRHRFDTRGKDSYRHRQAGAGLTIAVSGEETAVFTDSNAIDVRRIQAMAGDQFDIWLIEGDHLADNPKIFVTRLMDDFSGALPDNIVATIGADRINESLPHFADADYDALGAFVIETFLKQDSSL
jgi:molybdopterin-guanine dinucleotide biosynthesis protein B